MAGELVYRLQGFGARAHVVVLNRTASQHKKGTLGETLKIVLKNYIFKGLN